MSEDNRLDEYSAQQHIKKELVMSADDLLKEHIERKRLDEYNAQQYEYFYSSGIRYYRRGDLYSAIRYFDEATYLNLKAVGCAWLMKGKCFTKLGEYEEAITCFDNSALLDKLNLYGESVLCHAKATALCGLERYEEAILYYDKTLDIDPYDSETERERAKALWSLGRRYGAIKIYATSLLKQLSLRIELAYKKGIDLLYDFCISLWG